MNGWVERGEEAVGGELWKIEGIWMEETVWMDAWIGGRICKKDRYTFVKYALSTFNYVRSINDFNCMQKINDGTK